MISHLEKQIPDVMELRKNHLPVNWTDEKRNKELQVPTWLLVIISKCLEKDPKDRYADGIELYEAVCSNNEGLMSNEEVSLAINGLQNENEMLRRQLSNYKRLSKPQVLVIAALFLVAAIGAILLNLFGETREETVALQESRVQRDSIQTEQTSVYAEGDNNLQGRQTRDSLSGAKPVPAQNPPKKIINTKDGLVDDVPYF